MTPISPNAEPKIEQVHHKGKILNLILKFKLANFENIVFYIIDLTPSLLNDSSS